MPAEWEPQAGIWLAWSDEPDLWPGNFAEVEASYVDLITVLSRTERVRLLVRGEAHEAHVRSLLAAKDARLDHVECLAIPYDDCWMRDNGPIYLTDANGRKIIVDWGFNGWGDKFGPYDRDDVVPQKIAELQHLECLVPGWILEGGSIDNNGAGLLLTTEQCLLNPNRNGAKQREDLEPLLHGYFGARQVLWLRQGLCHDHTDGHIDNLTRFVATDHVVTVVGEDPGHPDRDVTEENLETLRSFRDPAGKPIQISTIPLPPPIEPAGEEAMSPSHANFILANKVVVVPTYGLGTDEKALATLTELFPGRRVVGLPSADILRGGGSFHCISQQEPI